MKKTLAIALCTIMTAGLFSGCSNNKNNDAQQAGEKYDIRVWASQEDQEILKTMANDFVAANTDATYNFTYGVVSEADASKEITKDPEAAGDVFFFASDQIATLVDAGALYPITKNKDEIIANNSEASIEAATVNGELYAYPSSADTYFLYYDKSKFTEDEASSLNKMLEKDLETGVTNFSMRLDDGWYQSGFFFGAGCTLFGENGTDPTQCDFNNEQGYKAAKFMLEMAQNPRFANHNDDKLKAAFATGTLGATISGTWNAADIEESLGDNFAATKLPSFTVDGEDYQLGSMANFKLIGVNSQTKNPLAAMQFAEWLASEDNQRTRFEQRSFAPTNIALSSNEEAMSSNKAVAAVAYQSRYSTLQTSIPQVANYWVPAEAFGAGLLDGTITEDNLQEKLDAYVASILSNIGE